MRLATLVSFALLCAVMATADHAHSATVSAPSAAQTPIFETHIRPILKAHCFQCHGEEDEIQGGLDLRMVRLMEKGGESGAALVKGNHAKSLLFERIAADEMPPGEKKLSVKDRETIARWIDGGAKTAKAEPAAIAEITDEDRTFWSFQPIRNPAPPKPKHTELVRTPIDAFLLAELEKHNLLFSPEADAAALCRRLYFDLTGLPPTPEEVAAFVADKSPKAYESLVDKLLASPHYGERWGRHWLDVAGYADSDGYTPLDPQRKYAYKYRDYVIRAFNADKPWNDFLIEQLAGDELVKQPYAEQSPEQLEKLVATGFLRMGPDGTGDTSVDQPLARNDCMAETLKIVSTSLLGLTVGCAQCHTHRYDPIPQSDYYRLRAVFEPAYDVKNWRAPGARLVSLITPAQKKQMNDIDVAIGKINREREAKINEMIAERLEIELAKLPENVRDPIREARRLLPAKLTPEQKKLLAQYPSTNVTSGSLYLYDRKRKDEFEAHYTKLVDELKAKRPVEDYVHALTEIPGKIPVTTVFFRGDHNAPRQAVKPGELSVLSDVAPTTIPEKDGKLPTTGRRLAYARHLVDGKHPLTARVLVNRFWMHHFGRGIVASPGDFGFNGEKPTHPELLDWLASDFMAGGWRLKRLHKTILMSTAYRQSSKRTKQLDAVDPDNRLLARMSVRRLEAEIIRDAVLAVSGNLNPKAFGPAVPVTPDDVGQVILGIDNRDTAGRPKNNRESIGDEAFRRSVYVEVRRTLPLGMLETFDAPTMTPNCEMRAVSTVPPQSLMFMNNDFVVTQSDVFAKRLRTASPDDLHGQLKLAWQLAYGRTPNDAELREAAAFIKTQISQFPPVDAAAVKKAAAAKQPPPPTPDERAMASFCQALLSSNGFLYVD